MSEPDRDTLLRTIEDFEATLAEFESNNVVFATTVLLRTAETIGGNTTSGGRQRY